MGLGSESEPESKSESDSVKKPLSIPIYLKFRAQAICFSSDFGLVVSFEQEKKIRVELPEEYQEKVCGICGNWNGDIDDDYFPFGLQTKGSYSEIGTSYKVAVPGEEEV